MKQRAMLLLLAGLFFAPANVKADVQFYTERSAWEAAFNSDISTENFDSVTPYFLEAGVNSAGLITIELLGHSQVNEFNSINDGPALSVNGTTFFRGLFSTNDIDSVTNLIFPSSVYAFGGDFVSTHSSNPEHSNDTIAIEVNGTQYSLDEILDPQGVGDGFLGFISSQAFSIISLFDPAVTDLNADPWIIRNGEAFGLDNVSFAVPEPITLTLLGLGAIRFRGRR